MTQVITPATTSALSVRDLNIDLRLTSGRVKAVRNVDIDVAPGETVCLVGESGSGKTLTALALMRLLPRVAEWSAASLEIGGTECAAISDSAFTAMSGNRVSMVFQNPMSALNPVFSIGSQLVEGYLRHGKGTPAQARSRAIELLERVGIPSPKERLIQFPHQLSGGLRQRVMIAMALMCEPALIIGDEPTTALDVTIQAQTLRLLKDLVQDLSVGLLLISHDLGVVSRMANRVDVMYAGRIVEGAAVGPVFSDPLHPYTRGLIDCAPDGAQVGRLRAIPGEVPALSTDPKGCDFANRCPAATSICMQDIPMRSAEDRKWRCVLDADHARQARQASQGGSAFVPTPKTDESLLRTVNVTRHYRVTRHKFARALRGVSIELATNGALGIVGESGCGKSTLAKLLLGLEKPDTGEVLLNGTPIEALSSRDRARIVQPVFQDPLGSLNPRKTIEQIVGMPLDALSVGDRPSRKARVREVLDLVEMPTRFHHMYPGQLSGGQAQRVAIARALAPAPSVLVCDEPTSALDTSVQAQILNLIQDLRSNANVAIVLISHDLTVVELMSDVLAVMYLGRVVECGSSQEIMNTPRHPYTQLLMRGSLKPDPTLPLPPDETRAIAPPSPTNVPAGCAFRTRCPFVAPLCQSAEPRLEAFRGREVACHRIEEITTAAVSEQTELV